jgi:hypothetical protein
MVLTRLPSGSGASGQCIFLRVSSDRVVLDPGWVGAVLPVHCGLTVVATAIALFRVVGTLSLGPGLKMTRPSIGLIRVVVVPRPVITPRTLMIPRPVITPRTLMIPRPVITPRTLMIPRPVITPRTLMIPRPVAGPRLRRVVAMCVIVIESGSLVASLGVVLMPVTGAVREGPTQVSERRASASMRRGHIPQQFRDEAFAASNV